MLLLTSIAIGIAIGLMVGGKIERLGDIYVRHWPFLFLALVVQVLAFSEPLCSSWLMMSYGGAVYGLTMIVLLVVIARNLAIPGMSVLLVGSALNAAVILANGGQMPVDQALLSQAIGELPPVECRDYYLNTAPMTDATRLAFLGDVLLVPEPLPLRNVFSIGDVFIALGGITIIVLAMRRQPDRSSSGASPGDDEPAWSMDGPSASPSPLDT